MRKYSIYDFSNFNNCLIFFLHYSNIDSFPKTACTKDLLQLLNIKHLALALILTVTCLFHSVMLWYCTVIWKGIGKLCKNLLLLIMCALGFDLQYEFWCEEASSTIVRVGRYSSECKTKEAISSLRNQFEKFVCPTVPQQEERIRQITELAVRLHGEKKTTTATTTKTLSSVDSYLSLLKVLLMKENQCI